MKKSKILTIFIIFIQIITSLTLNKECISLTEFEKNYSEFRNENNLNSRFRKNLKNKDCNSLNTFLENSEITIKRIKIFNPSIKLKMEKNIKMLKKINLEIEKKQLEGEKTFLTDYDFCIFSEKENLLFLKTEKLYKSMSEVSDEFFRKPQKDKIQIYIQIAKSIKELNSLNLIHNNINPKNIFFTNGNLKFIKLSNYDFISEIGEIGDRGDLMFLPFENLISEKTKSEKYNNLVSFAVSICELEMGREFLEKIFNSYFVSYKEKKETIKINIKKKKKYFKELEKKKIEEQIKKNNIKKIELEKFHKEIAHFTKQIYPNDLKKPNFIIQFFYSVFNFFTNNKKKTIYTFEDFLINILDNDYKNRRTIEDCIEIFKKFEKTHSFYDNKLKMANLENTEFYFSRNNNILF